MQNGKREENEKVNNLVQEIIDSINKAKITPTELIEVFSRTMFSIGKCNGGYSDDFTSSAEKIMLDYTQEPNLWNTLLAQAIWMKELWKEPQKNKEQ